MPKLLTTSKSEIISIQDRYVFKQVLGEGAYGVVYRGRDVKYNETIAIKKIKYSNQDKHDNIQQGISTTALKEIATLNELRHDNILKSLDSLYEDNGLYLIFEYLDWDLKRYMELPVYKYLKTNKRKKYIIYCVLKGLVYLHSCRIIHRDIKPHNILIDKNDNVKLADFGLTRYIILPFACMPHEIETLWYQAPEVLLKDDDYSYTVDLWSIGCVFAELYNKKPLFAENNEIDMLFKIFRTLGTPNDTHAHYLTQLPLFKDKYPKFEKMKWQLICPNMNLQELELLSQMLQMDPKKRISANKALLSPIFDEFRTKS